MITGVPIIFARGTKPQKRLSLELSRLSPIMKYSFGRHHEFAIHHVLRQILRPFRPSETSQLVTLRGGKFSTVECVGVRTVQRVRLVQSALRSRIPCLSTILMWSPGTPMQRLMKSG